MRDATSDCITATSEDEVKRKIASCWDRECRYYDCSGVLEDEIAIREEDAWKTFLSKELGRDRSRILDIGAGTGFLSLILADLGHEVVGVDISEGMLSICKRKAGNRGLKVDLKVGDAESLMFDDCSFDTVVCRWVLWTLPHPERAISEWKRVLRPGGRAYAFDTPYAGQSASGVGRALRDNLAKLMTTAIERRNAWSEDYDSDVRDCLPLHYDRPESFGMQADLFRACGLAEVETSMIEEVSAVWTKKWKNMPLRYRLGCRVNRDWHFIRGSKEISSSARYEGWRAVRER